MTALHRTLVFLYGLLAFAPATQAYQLVPVGTFADPTDIRDAPGAGNRLFVVERQGRIMLMKNEVTQQAPFLDIRGIVRFDGEQGLLSLAFPPNYAVTRKFYVLFVNNDQNVEVDEFLRASASADHAVRSSRRRVLVIPHPGAANHNGGQLHFDAAGRLYVSVGDGGHTATPGEPARKLNSLLGKILRILPARHGDRPYGIPKSNPFVGKPGRDEIFAYGLRNPWRISLEAANIFIGDVGEGSREEVDAVPLTDARGANFGWPEMEGDVVHDAARPGPDPDKLPVFVYPHSPACAIVGGYLVNDPDLPGLAGRYIYGDFCSGDIRSFVPDVAGQGSSDDQPVGVTASSYELVSFGRTSDGQIFVLAGGTVNRLEP